MQDQDAKVAEIKRELERKALKLPPKTIAIPGGADSKSTSSSVDKTASMESESQDESYINDSFYQKLNADKYYIDTIEEDAEEEEEETSLPSHVASENIKIQKELSHQQLLDLVESLYHNLRQADASKKKEKARRHTRERTIIKLAKELSKQSEFVNQQREQIEEVRCSVSQESATILHTRSSN